MMKTKKIAAALVTAASAATLLTGAAAPAAASPDSAAVAPWLNDPNSCSNIRTAVQRDVSNRTVQVRYGTCGGTQYGWGRILNYGRLDYIRFEVDLNGDRVADDYDYYFANARNYTAAYPTSSSSARAFRACFVTTPGGTCSASNATAWW
jgi:hypothetical protein